MPVQQAVERDETPYPYTVHDTTLRPLLNITIKSSIVVHSRSRSCSGGDICGTTPAFRSDVNIAVVAIQNSFWFNIVKNKEQTQKASSPNVVDWQYLGVDKFTRWLEWNYERTGRFSSNLEDGSAHLHTSRIVVRMHNDVKVRHRERGSAISDCRVYYSPKWIHIFSEVKWYIFGLKCLHININTNICDYFFLNRIYNKLEIDSL